MLIEVRRGRVLRTLFAMLAVVTLVAACSSHDDGPKGAKATSSTTAKGKGASAALPRKIEKGACDLLSRRDLSEVTGIEFDKAVANAGSCTYTSSEAIAAISLHFTALDGSDPKTAIAEATRTCDPGTAVLVDFPGAQGGFRCTVKGVASVGATGNEVFAVLLGATQRENVPTERVLQDLVTILQHAISGT